MDIHWIPITAIICCTALVLGLVAAVLHFRLEEERVRIETEIQRMELAYQRAQESLRG